MANAVVTWTSSNQAVATVTSQGLVTAVSNGTATITARSGNASAQIQVTVMQEAGRIVIKPQMATLMASGETVQLTATVLDQNGQQVEGAVVTWSSSDENVATVSPQGLVTAVGNGTATITARSGNASSRIDVKVMVASRDRETLIALYHATNGSNWSNNSNWLSDEPLMNWHGVKVNGQGEVYVLRLRNNNLQGRIPPEIGLLPDLESLDLRGNQLSGSIPTEIALLKNLEVLDLTDNQFSGSMPSEIGLLLNLHYLSLGRNQLSGSIPTEISQLQNLEILDLGSNQLSGGIPSEIGLLSNLTSLSLSRNLLTGPIPSEFGQLTRLLLLYLNENPGLFGPLPKEMTRLVRLESLWLKNTQVCVPNTKELQNWISKIPETSGITSCPNPDRDALMALYNGTNGSYWTYSTNWASFEPLGDWYGVTTDADGGVTAVRLSDNNLRGSIPSQLSNLASLKSLNLSFNAGLSGLVPLSFQQLDLEELSLQGTMLCAPLVPEFQEWLAGIPVAEVSNCTETRRDFYVLAEFYYSSNGSDWTNNTNWLSEAPLNEWYGVTTNALGEVIRLDLAENNLQGSITPLLGTLKALEGLILNGNLLKGSIPSELGQLSSLQHLNLGVRQLKSARNQLTGPIPPELGQLRSLEYLNLRGNGLSGPIPPELGKLGSLVHIDFLANQLSGSIPPEIGQLENLRLLNSSRNNLSGSIPPEIGQLKNLRSLVLFSNQLTGSIPPEIGQLENLRDLNLVNNKLTEPIPPELGQLKNLVGLNLFSNQLTGSIPPELGQLENLNWFYLDGNQFTGSIPAELGEIDNLRNLHLAWNQLTGGIPSELGQLLLLERLDLNHNQINGDIPSELGRLQKLHYLGLHHNDLEGVIPPELGGMTDLEELNISFNRLKGNIPHTLGDLVSLKSLVLTENREMSGTLPITLLNLNLEELLLGGTQLCVPPDQDFQEWLQTNPNRRVAQCAPREVESVFYLTQAIQSPYHPVSMVAGEDALLRVFVVNETGEDVDMPPVRATFYQEGSAVHTIDIPGQEYHVPRQIVEGDLSATANALVPGSVIMPGTEMVVEIDPDRALDPSLGITSRLPPMGRIALDARHVPPFELTLVPFLYTEDPGHALVDQIEQLTADNSIFRHTRDLLPIGEFKLEIHDPVWTSVEPDFSNRLVLLRELEAIWNVEGAKHHYMGILAGYGGQGHLPGYISVSGLLESTIAHELGHNMNLRHAPCGNAEGPDPHFPYMDGSIGAWGFDRHEGSLVSQDTPDLMTYCGPPYWISDFNFNKAMGYRLSQTKTTPMASAYATSARSLLLWGGVSESGDLVLEPAFIVDATPSFHQLDGPYQLTGEADDGRILFSVSIRMNEVADGEGSTFALILPVRPDWSDRLVKITLIGPEGAATLGGDEADQNVSTAALLLDSVSGKVRGILRDWPEPGVSMLTARRSLPEPGLEVVISRGVPTQADWQR